MACVPAGVVQVTTKNVLSEVKDPVQDGSNGILGGVVVARE